MTRVLVVGCGFPQLSLLRAAKRRHFIVVALVISAVLTPPDVISQLSLALPLVLLYEGSILSVRWSEKRAKARSSGEAPPDSASKPAE